MPQKLAMPPGTPDVYSVLGIGSMTRSLAPSQSGSASVLVAAPLGT